MEIKREGGMGVCGITLTAGGAAEGRILVAEVDLDWDVAWRSSSACGSRVGADGGMEDLEEGKRATKETNKYPTRTRAWRAPSQLHVRFSRLLIYRDTEFFFLFFFGPAKRNRMISNQISSS